jgi:hypothetical protein
VCAAVATAAGCAAVTEGNPPGPPPAWKQPYVGRIVLSADSLRDEVELFERLWSRRLSILGLQTRVVYDDNRAVFDVYGAPPSALAGVASVLAHPGGWQMHVSLDRGLVTDRLPPTTGCACSGQIRVRFSSTDDRCSWGTTAGPLEVRGPGGASLWIASLKVTWQYRYEIGGSVEGTAIRESDERLPSLECPKEQWPLVLVRLLPETSSEQATAIALAFGGGRLPEIPRVDSVAPAGATGLPP